MAIRRAIRLVCTLVMVAALAACAGHRARKGEPEMPLPPGVSEAPKGLKFSVKVTPTKFRVGERVSLEATMFNDSEKSFEKAFPTSCQWDYEIAAEARVYGPKRVCLPEGVELKLEPGELRMIMREWSGNDRYFDAAAPLEPGSYQVTAGLLDGERVIPMADPVTIQVLPR